MALTSDEVKQITSAITDAVSAVWQPLPNMLKTDLEAAISAADTWKDNNKTSYNSALPDTFRNNATDAQKSLLLMAVVAYEYLDSTDALAIAAMLLSKLIRLRTP